MPPPASLDLAAASHPPPPAAARSAAQANLRGAVLMVVSMACFTSNDSAIKYVSETLPLGEAIALRGMMVSALLIGVALWQGSLVLRLAGADRRAMGIRLFGEITSTILYLLALQHMALSELGAVMQSLPLLVMLAAAVVFGERIGWRRMAAVGVGLIGVLLILRPGTVAFSGWSLVALAAVLMVVVRDVGSRLFTPAVPSLTIAVWAAVSVTLAAFFIPDAAPWRWPTAAEAGGLALAGALISVGYTAAVAAMRVGEVSFVAPFRYTSLIVALALGMVIFGEHPSPTMLAGAALVVGAGLYSVLREGHLARRAA